MGVFLIDLSGNNHRARISHHSSKVQTVAFDLVTASEGSQDVECGRLRPLPGVNFTVAPDDRFLCRLRFLFSRLSPSVNLLGRLVRPIKSCHDGGLKNWSRHAEHHQQGEKNRLQSQYPVNQKRSENSISKSGKETDTLMMKIRQLLIKQTMSDVEVVHQNMRLGSNDQNHQQT